MDLSERRRQRLSQMLDLAQNYRGWTRKDLAKALGRDPTKLVPGSGVPKLDLVVDLADALDWSLEDVVAHFWREHESELSEENATDFDMLDLAAQAAHREGRYADLITLANRAYEIAQNGVDRARACNREAGGWDGIGRYQSSMKAIQRGLQERDVTGEYRRVLQSNLANAYYSIWSLLEAKAIARDLLDWYADAAPTTLRDRKTFLFAHYVAGQTGRRVLSQQADERAMVARRAMRHLEVAADGYEALAAELGDDSFRGIASTCRGGLAELRVATGDLDPIEALDGIVERLDHIYTPDGSVNVTGDELESYGWWCIFGCNIALRHLAEEDVVQRYMAIFTNKADEVAEELDNWAMRERVFTLEHTRWQRDEGASGMEPPALVDARDVRVITGTMARFPTFRETGWSILRHAKVISSS